MEGEAESPMEGTEKKPTEVSGPYRESNGGKAESPMEGEEKTDGRRGETDTQHKGLRAEGVPPSGIILNLYSERFKVCLVRSGPVWSVRSVPIEFPRKFISVYPHSCKKFGLVCTFPT